MPKWIKLALHPTIDCIFFLPSGKQKGKTFSMDILLHTAVTYPSPNQVIGNGFSGNRGSCLILRKGHTSSGFFTSQKLFHGLTKSVIVWAKNDKNNKKEDRHSFVPKASEATGFFPEAVLLKEKKVELDGKLLPEFANAEEQNLYEFLNLKLESQLNVERRRHYEVVYLIHEKHAEEAGSVSEKVQDFLREKKGKIWRLNDWGMRRLAYKIQKAKNAHYVMMNFELEAKWINDFKTLLDKDERVIRHLTIKRDEAITGDCPPPPEYHSVHADMDDYDEEDDLDSDNAYDDEDDEDDYDDEDYVEDLDGSVVENYDEGDEMEDGFIVVNHDENDDGNKDKNNHEMKNSWIPDKMDR